MYSGIDELLQSDKTRLTKGNIISRRLHHSIINKVTKKEGNIFTKALVIAAIFSKYVYFMTIYKSKNNFKLAVKKKSKQHQSNVKSRQRTIIKSFM